MTMRVLEGREERREKFFAGDVQKPSSAFHLYLFTHTPPLGLFHVLLLKTQYTGLKR